MPEMDGIETVQKIRGMGGKYEALIIVALTANAMKDARVLFFNSGFNDFLAKPINTSELKEIVVNYLPSEKVVVSSAPQQSHSHMEQELQRKAAVTFAKDNKDTFAKISGALSAGDIKTAHRIAHTLKSSAGYLGKTALQNAAESLESSLQKEPFTYTPEQLNIIETELSGALKEFAPLLALAEAALPSAVQVDAQALTALLSELRPLLAKSDFGASEYTERLQGITGMEELAERIENFDFEGALAVLDKHTH
jgi:HPt (histidine-containing phosphotransfer) domain-containing protein